MIVDFETLELEVAIDYKNFSLFQLVSPVFVINLLVVVVVEVVVLVFVVGVVVVVVVVGFVFVDFEAMVFVFDLLEFEQKLSLLNSNLNLELIEMPKKVLEAVMDKEKFPFFKKTKKQSQTSKRTKFSLFFLNVLTDAVKEGTGGGKGYSEVVEECNLSEEAKLNILAEPVESVLVVWSNLFEESKRVRVGDMSGGEEIWG